MGSEIPYGVRKHSTESEQLISRKISRRIYNYKGIVKLLGKDKLEFIYQGIQLSYLLYYIAIPPAALPQYRLLQ